MKAMNKSGPIVSTEEKIPVPLYHWPLHAYTSDPFDAQLKVCKNKYPII